MNAFFDKDILELTQCPSCGGNLNVTGDALHCGVCDAAFDIREEIPELFVSDSSKSNLSDRVKSFYEETPFPDYDEFDSLGSLISKAKKSVFAKALDDNLPFGAKILEVGCGTGQMTNYLSSAYRKAIGIDASFASLLLGKDFANEQKCARAGFAQMNLFKPAFKKESFDFVISLGVLHHTFNAYLAFQKCAQLVKPGGYFVFGLYHKWGRILQRIKRSIYKLFGPKDFLYSGTLKRQNVSEAKKQAWINDQFANLKETRHTINQSIKWLEKNGFEFISSIPAPGLFEKYELDKLFEKRERPSKAELMINEALMTFTNAREGGFFIVVGRKKAE